MTKKKDPFTNRAFLAGGVVLFAAGGAYALADFMDDWYTSLNLVNNPEILSIKEQLFVAGVALVALFGIGAFVAGVYSACQDHRKTITKGHFQSFGVKGLDESINLDQSQNSHQPKLPSNFVIPHNANLKSNISKTD